MINLSQSGKVKVRVFIADGDIVLHEVLVFTRGITDDKRDYSVRGAQDNNETGVDRSRNQRNCVHVFV